MNKLQKDWLAALRSGEYEQGRQALQDEDGRMCCLGVLCDIVDPGGWEVRYRQATGYFPTAGNYREELVWEGDHGMPPEWMQELVGLDVDEDEANNLAELNDSGRSFKEIADYLERLWALTP